MRAGIRLPKWASPLDMKYSARIVPSSSNRANPNWCVDVLMAKIINQGLFYEPCNVIIDYNGHQNDKEEDTRFLGQFPHLDIEGFPAHKFDK